MLHFHLDPFGDDAHDGSAAHPWRSLTAAVARVHEPTTLHLRGEHNLKVPLTIGVAQQGLVLQAWDEAVPTLAAVLELKDRRPLAAADLPLAPEALGKLWEMALPPGLLPAALLADGVEQPLARWPKTDRWEDWPLAAPGEGEKELRIARDQQRRHPNPTDVTVNFLSTPYTKWINYLGRVEAIDGERVTVDRYLVPNRLLKPTPTIPFRLENVLEAVTEPGEWAVDTRTGRLWWWPPKGIDPRTVRLSVPRLGTLIRIAGEAAAPVTGIVLRGLRLTGTNGPVEAAAVDLMHARDCLFEQCHFVGLGGAGIRIGGESREVTIRGCTLNDLGGVGIACHGQRLAVERTAGHHRIESNQFRRCGRVDWHAAAISLGGVSHCLVRANRLRELPYAGIVVGGTRLIFLLTATTHGEQELPFPREDLATMNPVSFKRWVNGYHRIEDNRLADVMMQLDDGGAIYCHASHHNELRGNVVFRTGRGNAFGLYFDDDETESLMEDNLVVDVPGAAGHGSAIHVHDNARNVIRRCLVVGTSRPFTVPASYGGHQFTDNLFAMTAEGPAPTPPKRATGRYPQIRYDGGENTFDRNTYWSEDGGKRARQVLRQMSELGYDLHSVVAAPGIRRDGPDGIVLPDGERLGMATADIVPQLRTFFKRQPVTP